ncbi:hypothetical protein MEBOL_002428 [Melittangium boletus DSM 14713]|uniref:Uncharacterized protein n=1 Tax=Melittangium boletus DSM 14713 TaxID=1294270 RepID=A0A250IAU1_9BACT|nr:hypothetical protein MEBOL_002428 [Melittangium boletus DSM 14713]
MSTATAEVTASRTPTAPSGTTPASTSEIKVQAQSEQVLSSPHHSHLRRPSGGERRKPVSMIRDEARSTTIRRKPGQPHDKGASTAKRRSRAKGASADAKKKSTRNAGRMWASGRYSGSLAVP